MEGAGGNGQFAAMFTHKGRDLEQNVFLHIHVIVVIGAHGKSIKKQLKGKVAAGVKIKGEKIMLDARMLGEHPVDRSEEHTSELQSLMRTSYDVFCLKIKK